MSDGRMERNQKDDSDILYESEALRMICYMIIYKRMRPVYGNCTAKRHRHWKTPSYLIITNPNRNSMNQQLSSPVRNRAQKKPRLSILLSLRPRFGNGSTS